SWLPGTDRTAAQQAVLVAKLTCQDTLSPHGRRSYSRILSKSWRRLMPRRSAVLVRLPPHASNARWIARRSTSAKSARSGIGSARFLAMGNPGSGDSTSWWELPSTKRRHRVIEPSLKGKLSEVTTHSASIVLVSTIFGLTYLGLALGEIPG